MIPWELNRHPGFMLTSGDRNSFTPWVITATLPVVVVVSSALKDSLQLNMVKFLEGNLEYVG